ncbi:FAD-dependent oxidoreductase [Limibaculum sp. M0105]|uniref:FAD-dependent oxidoreductase n=1 Tax=Thermohalobaculum xanthum TaxID=2753746 RepID=A0A8J7M611_9RHOB|nr:FAD-dependent oxidoreductase [Thermohalobaculum xanthum]MBK0398871.1 FAD-dependent oxidoreductase [Thermohalobaculum xanthum]
MAETTDLLVIGAGVFGLWTARAAARAGMRVILAEADIPGAGASGGLVGALTPHQPDRWRPFKQFQFDGLVTLGARAAELAAETGIDPGHARCGRITPLVDERSRERALAHSRAAREVWSGAAEFEVLDSVPQGAQGLIAPEAAPFGVVRDTLSGRIGPRALVEALAHSVSRMAQIRSGWRLRSLAARDGVARFDRGDISAGHVVLAAGWGCLDFLPASCLPEDGRSGPGVKGQAALLAARADPGAPVIQANGIYIVPHADGRIAVGSTSEKTWRADGPDARLDALVETAASLAPALRGAEVVERWAGIRPRAPGREPLVGPLPGAPRLVLATGGYKIGFSIAHLVGDAVCTMIAGHGRPSGLPDSFTPEAHGLRAEERRI